MTVQLISGMDVTLRVRVFDEVGRWLPINAASTVRACLRIDQIKVTDDITCLAVTNGADWDNGLVAIPVSAAQSENIPHCSVVSAEVDIRYMGAVNKQIARHIEVIQGVIH